MVSEFDLTHASDCQLINYWCTGTGFILRYYNLLPNLKVWENVQLASLITNSALGAGNV